MGGGPATMQAAAQEAAKLVLCFGACGIVQHLAKEIQHPIFTPVSQVRGALRGAPRAVPRGRRCLPRPPSLPTAPVPLPGTGAALH
jgi:hypothetical protein